MELQMHIVSQWLLAGEQVYWYVGGVKTTTSTSLVQWQILPYILKYVDIFQYHQNLPHITGVNIYDLSLLILNDTENCEVADISLYIYKKKSLIVRSDVTEKRRITNFVYTPKYVWSLQVNESQCYLRSILLNGVKLQLISYVFIILL